jgi:hypothetical protein
MGQLAMSSKPSDFALKMSAISSKNYSVSPLRQDESGRR